MQHLCKNCIPQSWFPIWEWQNFPGYSYYMIFSIDDFHLYVKRYLQCSEDQSVGDSLVSPDWNICAANSLFKCCPGIHGPQSLRPNNVCFTLDNVFGPCSSILPNRYHVNVFGSFGHSLCAGVILPSVVNLWRMRVKETVRKSQSVCFAEEIMQHGGLTVQREQRRLIGTNRGKKQ